jgi:hypothetical protein
MLFPACLVHGIPESSIKQGRDGPFRVCLPKGANWRKPLAFEKRHGVPQVIPDFAQIPNCRGLLYLVLGKPRKCMGFPGICVCRHFGNSKNHPKNKQITGFMEIAANIGHSQLVAKGRAE